jgi:hypothetical protein
MEHELSMKTTPVIKNNFFIDGNFIFTLAPYSYEYLATKLIQFQSF